MELLILLMVIIGIIISTVRFKIHPVFSLTVAGILCGFLFGIETEAILKIIAEGFGNTLSSIGLVIAFGSIIGIFLEKTGGTQVLANALLRLVGLKNSPLAMNLAGLIISIPVYCDSGFVILSSLNKALSFKSGIRLIVFAIALATGLYSSHVFVPPTPGPLAAAAILDADLGLVMILGLSVALAASLAGYFWALFIGKRINNSQYDNIEVTTEDVSISMENAPSFLNTLTPLLLPLILIGMKSLATYPTQPLGNGFFSKAMIFLGNPIIALLIGALIAIQLGRKNNQTSSRWIGIALQQAGSIVLITGAGGAFGAILRTLDFESLFSIGSVSGMGGLWVAFALAAVLKSAQGSSTVSIITTAAIIAPLLGTFGLNAVLVNALCVLAIGAGAMTVSHVNDSYFWVVSEFSNLNLNTALRAHTTATLIQGLTAMLVISILYTFLQSL